MRKIQWEKLVCVSRDFTTRRRKEKAREGGVGGGGSPALFRRVQMFSVNWVFKGFFSGSRFSFLQLGRRWHLALSVSKQAEFDGFTNTPQRLEGYISSSTVPINPLSGLVKPPLKQHWLLKKIWKSKNPTVWLWPSKKRCCSSENTLLKYVTLEQLKHSSLHFFS